MRVFWLIVALLVAGAGAIMFTSSRRAESSRPRTDAGRAGATAPPESNPAGQIPANASSPQAAVPALPVAIETQAPSPSPAQTTTVPTVVIPNAQPGEAAPIEIIVPIPPSPVNEPTAPTAAPTLEPEATSPTSPPAAVPAVTAPAPAVKDPATSESEKPAVVVIPTAPSSDPAAPTSTPTTPTTPTTSPASPAAAGTAPAEVVVDTSPIPAKFETLADGSVKVDGRFIVKGDGSAQKPYEVTWDQLVSASDIYNPRDGKKRLPERVTMLDGKFVKLSGYVAFPLYTEKPRELLSMLNQWDGCCIGVPPTPFDAVEVRLKTPVEGGDRYATQAVVTGKFGVKPYLSGDWLVGLYVMDDAELSTKSTAGANRN